MRIALVEDDQHQAELLKIWLEAEGHDCRFFLTGQDFMKEIRRESYDLLIIDWVLPDINGDKIVVWVRENLDWPIPVLFVTQKDSEIDIIHALNIGADDYMVKPVSAAVLMARVEALARRTGAGDQETKIIENGKYRLDPKNHLVTRNDEEIPLTQKEYELTFFLFRNLGRIVSRDHLLETVWGKNPDINTRTVDTHISRVRKKLGLTPDSGLRLSAVYQHGYRLEQIQS